MSKAKYTVITVGNTTTYIRTSRLEKIPPRPPIGTRIKLIEDLTSYDSLLTVGQLGTICPVVGFWGRTLDKFVGVKFDCGLTFDAMIKSLQVIK